MQCHYGQDIKRRFPAIMDLYSGAGHIIKEMEPEITQKLTMADASGAHLISPIEH